MAAGGALGARVQGPGSRTSKGAVREAVMSGSFRSRHDMSALCCSGDGWGCQSGGPSRWEKAH